MLVKCCVVLCVHFLFVHGISIDDVSYYSMPKLYELDDYETCVARSGIFCRGKFTLTLGSNVKLLQDLRNFSSHNLMYDHTLLHRGYCISSRCSHIKASSNVQIFKDCLAQSTASEHNLTVETIESECFTEEPIQIDKYDIIFACVVGFILICNIFGTVYDFSRNQNDKQNKFLSAWSLRNSWHRFVSQKETGNPHIVPLLPFDGIKTLIMICVIMAHTLFLYFQGYIYNPRFLEKANLTVMAAVVANGTAVVQIFFMISSFIFAYTVLHNHEKHPDKTYGFGFWIFSVLHRLARLYPVYIFALALHATWWRHATSGPLWNMIMGAHTGYCRTSWWWHVGLVLNLADIHDKCLVQSWYIAVEMQLFLITCSLMMLLAHKPRRAMFVLPILAAFAVAANFVASFIWDLKPMVYFRKPEEMGRFVGDEKSFNWFYTSPWGSLPESLIGLFNGFLFQHLLKSKINIKDSMLFTISFYLSLPLLILWFVPGYWLQYIDKPLLTAAYNAINRVGFIIIFSVFVFGLFFKVNEMLYKFLSWRGWQITSKLSLSVLMLHLGFILWVDASRFQPFAATYSSMISDAVYLTVVTHLAAIPLFLLVETPCRNFLAELINLMA